MFGASEDDLATADASYGFIDSPPIPELPSSPASKAREQLLARTPHFVFRFWHWLNGSGKETPLVPLKSWVRFRGIAFESALMRKTRRITSPYLLAALIPVYIISLAFFARAQWYQTPADAFAECTSSFWLPNDQCGLDGSSCLPFNSSSPIEFRCPASCSSVILANIRAVGAEEVVYKPLVVGGGDSQGTYRGDSWICLAAAQTGVITSRNGGCGALDLVGSFTDFVGFSKNGVSSVDFPSTFPLSYRFVHETIKYSHCSDLRDYALAFNVLVTVILSLLLRPTALVLFWCLVCIGYWHITFFSDPRAAPAPISDAFGTFLPTLFVSYAFYRSAVRFVLPEMSHLPVERTFWYLGGFWVGVLMNITFDAVPIDRLTPSDIRARPGGITAVVILGLIVLFLVLNQIRIIRNTGQLATYLGYYTLGGLTIAVLASLPGLEFRLHHYVFAMLLIPGTAFPTRLSALMQALLLGMFLNGVARWGFDSILQTSSELQRDAPLASSLPEFPPNLSFSPFSSISNSSSLIASTLVSSLASNASSLSAQQYLTWPPIPSDLAKSEGWSGFALIVDDVERYTGTGLNYSLRSSTGNDVLDWSVRHFFRLAYQQNGVSGAFTRAATIFPNGTYIPPLDGPS